MSADGWVGGIVTTGWVAPTDIVPAPPVSIPAEPAGPCPDCAGTGMVTRRCTCEACPGHARPCEDCDGTGHIEASGPFTMEPGAVLNIPAVQVKRGGVSFRPRPGE